MNGFVLKLLGGQLEPGAQVLRARLGSGGGIAFIWLLLAGLILVPAAYVSYRRTADRITSLRRHALILLRITYFLLLLAFQNYTT